MKTVIRNSYVPKLGDYCNTLVVDKETGNQYLFDKDGVWTLISTDEEGIVAEAVAQANAYTDDVAADKVDKEEGKGLSENDFTDEDKDKLDSVEAGAQENVIEVVKRNGTTLSITDKTVDISVPTTTSALTNDSGYITNAVNDLVNYYDKDATDELIAGEALARDGADQELQEQIDAIVASSDVVDIVGTYAELQNYDTSKLHDNDIIKVLTDSTHDDATTYYRWDDDTDTFSYIGAEGPYYTKGEADATFVPLTRTINGKGLNSDVVLTAADVGALPSSTVIPTVNDATLTIQKNGVDVQTFTANQAANATANITVPTKTSDLTNDGADNTSTYVEADELATVATSGSYNDLTDKPTINFELVEMSYGESNAWAKFIAAYQGHKIVYCRASSNTDPSTGTQGRKAFMAYVNNAENPTEVEFQYVRSVSSKTSSQPVDQVFVYKLTNANGGTWTVQTRNMAPKLAQGTNTTVSYSNGTYTISATQPTVNDATLTIQKNGTTVETFTANSSTNKTANITVPTKTSDLTNDSGFIDKDVNNLTNYYTETQVNGMFNALTIPTKTSDLTNDSGFVSNTDYASANNAGVIKVGTGLSIDANGVLSSSGLTSVDWTDITNKPTNVSYWTNDAGYITSAALPTKTSDLTNDSGFITSASLPTKTSDLTNDSGFITSSVSNLANYYTKSDTYSQSEVNSLLSAIVVPTKTSDLTNDGSDGTSTYVEANDLATVATSGSYADLSNKPTIGDATLTIQKNGTDVQTFTANATSNKTANITVPTATSELTNDSNFVSSTDYATANAAGVIKVGSGLEITSGVLSATGGGVADAVEWDNVLNKPTFATVATSGSYNDLSNKPTIPTVNDATLTIQRNSTSVGTFTANASSNKTINITVPTTAADVSALPASTKYGASISVSINTTDYKMTTTLKDQDGNTLGTAQVIDLPLESVVVSGSYDNTNKKIVLTLQSGSTIDIPVGDLVAGLQSEITSSNKLASDLVDDTNQTHKFMTSAEKTKLSGIAAGAEVNVQSDWNQTTNTADDYIKNKPTLATVATSGSYNDLSNKPTIPAAQVQSNWTQTTTTAVDYIKNKPTLATVATSGSYNDLSNKPTIPTVNNATLTIQKNGTTVNTFTANASSNVTANISVPTKTSDLTNDSDFATKAYIQSRDENLVTNGSGLLGDNYNFSMFTFDPVNAYGTPGSFKTTTRQAVLYNDEYIPVDITSSYKMSFDIKTTNGSAKFYNAIQSYDVDKQSILFRHVNWIANTTTTLSQALNTGDTVIHLTSAANWNTTTSYSYQKGIIVWNYENSYGYKYAAETYSRNVYSAIYTDNSAVNKTNNTITLPSGWTGPNLPAGTSVSQCTDGSTYIYIGDQNYTVTANTWVHKEGILSPNMYRAGTAYIRIGWLANRDITGDISTWFNNVKFYEYTAIPTVNNGTLTIQKNGSNVTTFTANQSSNATANIVTDELQRKSDTRSSMRPSDANYPSKATLHFSTVGAFDNQTNTGGFVDALVLNSWSNDSGGRVNALVATKQDAQKLYHYTGTFNGSSWSGKKEIAYSDAVPTKTSDLTNDSGFLTSIPTASASTLGGIKVGSGLSISNGVLSTNATAPDWSDITNKPTFATVATSGSYNDLSNKPTIPTVNNATLTIQKNGTTVKTFTANASSNVTANITVPTTVAELSDAGNYATNTALDDKQDVLTAGNHISISNDTISATGYVHSENPVAAASSTATVTGSMIANGTITADKLASGATVKLTLSTTDIGEGAALAANTLYGVYQ